MIFYPYILSNCISVFENYDQNSFLPTTFLYISLSWKWLIDMNMLPLQKIVSTTFQIDVNISLDGKSLFTSINDVLF